jgi:elongator complex protein 2
VTAQAEMQEEPHAGALDWSRPPLEGQLVQRFWFCECVCTLNREQVDYTLWPEVRKLYGHPFEVVAMAVSASGALLASACKARTDSAACIRLWDTASWQCVCELRAHSNTCVHLDFACGTDMCDHLLVSAGKDRRLCMHSSVDGRSWQTSACVNNAHKRIIWACR